MISGSKIRIEAAGAGCAGALGAAGAGFRASPAWAFDLPELMGLLAQQKSGEARFTEQRFVRGLEGPLDASGMLSFTAPDRLVRRTLSPRPETMAVEGNTLTLSRGGRTPHAGARQHARAARHGRSHARHARPATRRRLQRYFRSTRRRARPPSWTLDLAPIDARLAAQVRSLRLSGTRAARCWASRWSSSAATARS